MKKITIFGILALFVISMIPFGIADNNEYMKDFDGKEKRIDRDTKEETPMLEEVLAVRNSDNNKCDVLLRTCKYAITSSYRPFVLGGETFYIRGLFTSLKDDNKYIMIKDSQGTIIISQWIEQEGKLGDVSYKVEKRKWSADRIHLWIEDELKEYIQ